MAHTIQLKVDLLDKRLCSGCPCNHDSRCFLDYWDTRQYWWFNWRTGELGEPFGTCDGLSTADGWGCRTKRPQQCIDELG